MAPKQPTALRSIIVVPSKIAPTGNAVDGTEEHEITAEISLPAEGGWGWVVVTASFMCTFLMDGIFFTFGSIYQDIVLDMGIETTLVALVNSVAVALYFMSGPFVSALINRFGFRACSMSGSIIVSISLVCAYFATSYLTLILFYGVICGFGGCLIAMPSAIVVGFYFERLRALALSIATAGSSVGIMVMFYVNTYLVNFAGWRITTLIHSGLIGTIYFMAMAYRPLLSLTVAKTTDDPTRTVTYLPSLVTTPVDRASRTVVKEGMSSPTERLFSAVSNAHFPTAASMVEEGIITQPTVPNQAGPSAAGVSKLTLTARAPQGGISARQIRQVQSIMSRASVQEKKNIEVTVLMKKPPSSKKQSCWGRLCQWEEHIPEARPMYRDDAFYEGRLENLPAYQKSTMSTVPEARTGIEYQLAVSRAVTTADLEDRQGVLTTAARRILATMMDPTLLKRCSFLSISFSGFLVYAGFLIPYVFIPDKNKSVGIDQKHCSLFVSVIALSSLFGRFIAGSLACKYSPLKLYCSGCFSSGIAIMAFNMLYDVYYQYGCCVYFGVSASFVSSLRSVVLVDSYGLDKLTNATGMLLLFQGFGSLISTPLSSVLKNSFGYSVSFYVAGSVLLLGGCVLLPVKKILAKEKDIEMNKDNKNVTIKQPTSPIRK